MNRTHAVLLDQDWRLDGRSRRRIFDIIGTSGLKQSVVTIGLEATVSSFGKGRFVRFAFHDRCKLWTVTKHPVRAALNDFRSDSRHVLESVVFQLPTVLGIVRKEASHRGPSSSSTSTPRPL